VIKKLNPVIFIITSLILISCDSGGGDDCQSDCKPDVITQSSFPDLVPYTPAGWDDPLVLRTDSGEACTASVCQSSATITNKDTLYVYWAAKNIGNAESGNYSVKVYVDGELKVTKPQETSIIADEWEWGPQSSVDLGSFSSGSYKIKLVLDAENSVIESGESNNEYSYTFTVTAASPPSLPDLVPYTPTGWDDALVLRTDSGEACTASVCQSSATITDKDTLYVYWAAKNIGNAESGNYSVKVYVDGELKVRWSSASSLSADKWGWGNDPNGHLGSYNTGAHTIRLILDEDNSVTESNESNNEYSYTFTVTDASLPDLVPYTPTGWDDALVLRTDSGEVCSASACQASATITDKDTLYVHWAAKNIGNIETGDYSVKVYIDDEFKVKWPSASSLSADKWGWGNDPNGHLGSYNTGTHTIRLILDEDDSVTESNESNNEYSYTFSVIDASVNKARLSGSLLVSTVGQPGETVIAEQEPNDDVVTANFLGPLTTDIDYRVTAKLLLDDKQDVFWVTEAISQRVTVTLTHDDAVDFDLQVWDVLADGTFKLIGKSEKSTSPDTVTYNTPEGDKYVTAIVITPYEGSGNYEILINSEPPTQQQNASHSSLVATEGRFASHVSGSDHTAKSAEKVWDVTSFEAVPGEILVKPHETMAANTFSVNTNSWNGLTACGGVTGVATLLCDEGATFNGVLSYAAKQNNAVNLQQRTLGRILRLRANPQVEEAIPNYIVQPLAVPNDEFYSLQWHYPLIGLPEAWETTTGSEDVIVAVLDTGIVNHPDLQGRLIPGYDFVSNISYASDGDGIDPDPTEPAYTDPNIENSWHGTHVAGTIGASTNNNAGVAGVDWHSKIMPIRVLGQGGGSISDMLEGIKYAAGLPNSSGTVPSRRADIINMSLGGGQASQTGQLVYDQARAAGVLIIAAAGNDKSSVPSFPAAAENVLSVSAVDLNRRLAPYSNYGSTIDIAAPGGNTGQDLNGDGYRDGVLSTLVIDSEYGYKFYDGTSMAAPHVAGVAALILAANPNLTVGELENILLSTATDLGQAGRDDDYGYGLVNAAAAVQLAAGMTAPPASLDVSPSKLHFDVNQDRLEVALMSASLKDLNISILSVSTNDGNAWLSTRLTTGDITPLIIEVDRAGLANGDYVGQVILNSDLGNYNVVVSMEVVSNSQAPDVGTITLRLENATDGQTAMETQTSQSSDYRYLFSDVPGGKYYLRAGTDNDSDGKICEIGEYCGAYLSLNDPAVIEVGQGATLSALDFPLTYQDKGVDESKPLPDDPKVPLLQQLLGAWDFSYVVSGSMYSRKYYLDSIEVASDGPMIAGKNEYGDVLVVTAEVEPALGYNYSMLAPGNKQVEKVDRLFLFNLTGNAVTGRYWQIDQETGEFVDIETWYDMTGERLDASATHITTQTSDESIEIEMVVDVAQRDVHILSQTEASTVTRALRKLHDVSRKIRSRNSGSDEN